MKKSKYVKKEGIWITGFMWDGLKIDRRNVVAWQKVSYNNSPTKAYLG